MTSASGATVVVGLDRSDPGRAAVEYAAELALSQHRPLRLVHAFEASRYAVRPPVGWRGDLHGILHSSAERLVEETVEVLAMVYPELIVQTRLEPGSAVRTLVEESERASAVVVGSRGSGALADLILGSTTLHVATQAGCPVIAVPVPADHEQPRHGVVVGVDGSAESMAAIEFAFETAAARSEQLVAVHVWRDPAQLGTGVMLPLVYDPALVAAEERLVLAESMVGWAEKYPDVPVEHRVLRGATVVRLVEASRSATLVVVGCRGRGTVASLLGSVSHGVLHHATCPVAVVHQHGPARSA